MEKSGSHEAVVSSRVMFGEVVTEVRCTGLPVDEELALFGPVFDPIKSHVDCLGSFLFYGVIGKITIY